MRDCTLNPYKRYLPLTAAREMSSPLTLTVKPKPKPKPKSQAELLRELSVAEPVFKIYR